MPSNTSPITVVNNRLYVPEDDASIKYLTLTGSTTAGYTAVATTFTIQSIGTGHGLAGGTITGMASYLTFIYQSSNTANGTQPLAHGWDYTAGSGDTVGQASDISTGTVSNARIAVDTDGTLYVFNSSQRTRLYAFYPTGQATANVLNIDRTHSFPLGSRQANTYGFGRDATNDRFFVPNVNRVNTYDKTVTGAARTWQPFNLLGTTLNVSSILNRAGGNTLLYGFGFVVVGNRAFLIGSSSRRSPNQATQIAIFSWPDLSFIEQRFLGTHYRATSVKFDGKPFFQESTSTSSSLYRYMRELSTSTYTISTSRGIFLPALSSSGFYQWMFQDGDTVYLKNSRSVTLTAVSSAGTGTKTAIAGNTLAITDNTNSTRCGFADNENFYIGVWGPYSNQGTYPFLFNAYSKTGRTRNQSADWDTGIRSGSQESDFNSVYIDGVLYLFNQVRNINVYVRA